MDFLTPAERSERMSRIKSKDTTPEVILRRLLHSLGYRYCLHRRDLPGTPDIVFPARLKVIWVHGCFWHWHDDPSCSIAKIPKSRPDFWTQKLTRNRDRDVRDRVELHRIGWSSHTVWECQLRLRYRERLMDELQRFLRT
jgi:DNA mismatch endonuclease, patch repair protein